MTEGERRSFQCFVFQDFNDEFLCQHRVREEATQVDHTESHGFQRLLDDREATVLQTSIAEYIKRRPAVQPEQKEQVRVEEPPATISQLVGELSPEEKKRESNAKKQRERNKLDAMRKKRDALKAKDEEIKRNQTKRKQMRYKSEEAQRHVQEQEEQRELREVRNQSKFHPRKWGYFILTEMTVLTTERV